MPAIKTEDTEVTTTERNSFFCLEGAAVLDEEKEQVTVFRSIRLNPGISKLNFYCMLLYYFSMIYGLAAPAGLQTLILLSREYYDVPQDHAGAVNSLVIIVQSLVKMATTVPYGYLADKFGRRVIIVFAAINYFFGSILIPMQTTIVPGFILAKALQANAISGMQSVPLLADYIADESKGKASAAFALIMGIGALSANLSVKGLFYFHLPLGTCYYAVGVFTLVIILMATLGLKKGTYHNNVSTVQIDELKAKVPEISFRESMREAIAVFKVNDWLKISLVLQVLGSSDFQVFMTFITLYLKSLFPAQTPEDDQNIAANNLQTMIIVPMLVFNGVYGLLLDKKKMIIQPSMFALIGGAVSFILFAISREPKASTIYIGALLFGSTLPGLFTITNYLNIKNFPPEKRGIMIGFCHLASQAGYFVIATGGGILYDYWRRDGLFYICAGLLVFASILVGIIYKNMISKSSISGSSEKSINTPILA